MLSSTNLVAILLAVLVPVLTGYATQGIVNLTKFVTAFATSRPWVKQAWAFVVAAVISICLTLFHSTDVGVVMNTLVGAALAMLFHVSAKTSAPRT